jgi:unspecific monooxygenase
MAEASEFVLNIFDPAVKADPYPHYAEMHRTGRVLTNPFLGGQFMVPGYDDVAAVLADPATFSNAGLGSSGMSASGAGASLMLAETMLSSDPPDHERLRGPVARAFTPRSVNALTGRMEQVARDLLAPLAAGEPFDVVADLGERLPVLIIAEMLGVGTADLDDFVAWSHGLLGVLDMFAGPEKVTHAHACSKDLHGYFAAEVARRRDQPSDDDLVGRLVAANADGRLTEEEMLSSCVLLLLGGNETTTKLITNAALALFRNPDQRARLVADPALVATAADESLRYDTPVQANGRVTTRDAEVAGITIPQGSLVFCLLGAANRDPAQFDAPDTFDVGRDPNPHLAFSRGIHHCLGASLARLEARAAITALIDAAPDYAVDEPDGLQYGATFFFHAPTRLRILAT